MILEPNFAVAAAHSLDRLPQGEREEVFAHFVPESGRATFEMMHWGLDMRRASEVDAKKVTCPLLFLAGSEDRINPPGTVERIAALYKDRAVYETLPGMSHWLIGEPGWERVRTVRSRGSLISPIVSWVELRPRSGRNGLVDLSSSEHPGSVGVLAVRLIHQRLRRAGRVTTKLRRALGRVSYAFFQNLS